MAADPAIEMGTTDIKSEASTNGNMFENRFLDLLNTATEAIGPSARRDRDEIGTRREQGRADGCIGREKGDVVSLVVG